jgi:hypothetical protein
MWWLRVRVGWKEDREAADRVVISLDLTKERRTRHSGTTRPGVSPSLFNHPGSATTNLETPYLRFSWSPIFCSPAPDASPPNSLAKENKNKIMNKYNLAQFNVEISGSNLSESCRNWNCE